MSRRKRRRRKRGIHPSLFFIPLLLLFLLLLKGREAIIPQGGGVTFTDVTEEAGLRFRHVHGGIGEKYFVETMGSGAAFLDYDNDGDLDIYLVNSAPLPGFTLPDSLSPLRNALFRNNGDGTYTDV
ncbi:VCBS repeat-containing protein, partial [candidate division TA06 bacterium]|nr:VCBS repeat-containing protein [candidate division TA06 bacterium]